MDNKRNIFLPIGFKNTILNNEIEAMFSYKIFSYTINEEYLEKKKREAKITLMNKRDKKSAILLKDGSIIISPLDVETLVKRSR